MADLNTNIRTSREDYNLDVLDESKVLDNPFKQFENWINLAFSKNVHEPIAMNLATAIHNRPSSRIVLLRGFDENGFVFFTNYSSNKGKQLMENPYAAINFYWSDLNKQVRIEGNIKQATTDVSDEYFHSRPRESQLGAWASEQSTVIESRQVLEQKMKSLEKEYEGKEIPRPPYWGGFVLIPQMFEFWQGRSNRLHDRIIYTLSGNTWKKQRLAP